MLSQPRIFMKIDLYNKEKNPNVDEYQSINTLIVIPSRHFNPPHHCGVNALYGSLRVPNQNNVRIDA